MKRRIENGVTIISTGDSKGGQKNKVGFRGVSKYATRYRADIVFDHVKYTLGMFEDKETAIKARKVAEAKKSEGTLSDFLEIRPHGNSIDYMGFWHQCFREYNL